MKKGKSISRKQGNISVESCRFHFTSKRRSDVQCLAERVLQLVAFFLDGSRRLLLAVFCQLFFQVTFATAIHGRLVFIDTKILGNKRFVEEIICLYDEPAKGLHQQDDQQQYGGSLFDCLFCFWNTKDTDFLGFKIQL